MWVQVFSHLTDFDLWVDAGRPGADPPIPWPHPRSAHPDQLRGDILSPREVGEAVGLTARRVLELAADSINWIRAWEWENQLGDRGPEKVSLVRRLRVFSPPLDEAHLGQAYLIKTEHEWGQNPEPRVSWEWIPLPEDAPASCSERVLLRTSEGKQAKSTKDESVAFAITRKKLGRGRGRGWLFQEAFIGDQLQIERLPSWLTPNWTLQQGVPD